MSSKRSYDINLVERAVMDVQSGAKSYREAAKAYGIPRSTIEFKLKNPGHKDTFGPATVLTGQEELSLEKWILDMANKGFPRKKEDILSSVQKFLEGNPRKTPFKDGRPGDGWLKAFLKRHPIITERTSEGVTAASACVSEKDIRKWFADIKSYFEERNLNDVLKDPSRIFNGDETGFIICPKTGKVYAEKGAKNVYNIEKGQAKECITVMFTFSADGQTCNPMVVYPYKRIPDKIIKCVNPSWGIGRSDKGWMTSETFYEYIGNVFYPNLLKNNVKFPVILFVDGHKSHMSYELSELCERLQIELIALYPNATRILQPADVAAFFPLKAAWKKAVQEWNTEHPEEILNKVSFAPLLEKTINGGGIKPINIIHGFEVCGIYAFNADAVDYSKCLGKKNKDKIIDREERSLKYDDFVKVVGDEKVKIFEEVQSVVERTNNNNDDNFWSLFRLWQFFQKATNGSGDDIDFQAKGPQHGTNSEVIDVNVMPGSHSDVYEIEPICQEQPKVIVLQNEIIQPPDCVNPSPIPVGERPPGKRNIDEYLAYPRTPERKGKRQTDKLPFAITSEKYREMLSKKKDQKDHELQEKEARKRKRLETRIEKSKKPTISCNTCHSVIKGKVYLMCDNCKNYFHKRCVPRSHKIHIPEEEDDLYVCHKCYKDDSDHESDNVSSISRDELDERSELEFNQTNLEEDWKEEMEPRKSRTDRYEEDREDEQLQVNEKDEELEDDNREEDSDEEDSRTEKNDREDEQDTDELYNFYLSARSANT